MLITLFSHNTQTIKTQILIFWDISRNYYFLNDGIFLFLPKI